MATKSQTKVVLPDSFGYVLASASFTALHCLVGGGYYAAMARRKHFGPEFLAQFEEQHKGSGLQGGVASGGYPDMGSGRYSSKLSYRAWYEFNCFQRIHYNFVEGLTPAVMFQLVGGINYPVQSAVLGAFYNLGRIIYGMGYSSGGPSKRLAGAIVLELSLLGGLVLTVLTVLEILGIKKK